MQINIGVKSAVYPDGTSLSDIMTFNHFGTPTIPPRPVLRIAAENVLGHEDIQIAIKPLQQSLFDVTQVVEKYSQVERVKQKPSETLE